MWGLNGRSAAQFLARARRRDGRVARDAAMAGERDVGRAMLV